MSTTRLALFAATLAACKPDPGITLPRSKGVAIGTVALEWSNVHAVFGEDVLLVDSGTQGEYHALTRGLRRIGVRMSDVECAVITHGHADHAGTARALQLAGVTIIAGAGDRARTERGVHGPHNPTGFFSALLKHLLPETYKPFVADIEVVDPLRTPCRPGHAVACGRYDLRPTCGVDGEVIAVGGHTAGSVVVLVGGGKVALVGDLFRGGQLAGYVNRDEPMVHFYQDDKARAHAQIRALLARGVEWFVLGHGGPAKRADVVRVFR